MSVGSTSAMRRFGSGGTGSGRCSPRKSENDVSRGWRKIYDEGEQLDPNRHRVGESGNVAKGRRTVMNRKPPVGKDSNWLETIPGKSWFPGLRMYGPLEPWINKTWRPSEIESVK